MSHRAHPLALEEYRMNQPLLPQAQLLFKPEEAAKVLAVGRTQVYALIASGQLESVQIGRLRRIPIAACERYVSNLQQARQATTDNADGDGVCVADRLHSKTAS